MLYLLDTNICIYLIKKRPPEVYKQFQKRAVRDIAISMITMFELEYGVEKSQHRKRSQNALAKFLQSLNLIDLDFAAAKEAAAIRVQLEKKGLPIGPFDLLIAGTARSRNMVLVTNKPKEFERVDDLELENWVG